MKKIKNGTAGKKTDNSQSLVNVSLCGKCNRHLYVLYKSDEGTPSKSSWHKNADLRFLDLQ